MISSLVTALIVIAIIWIVAYLVNWFLGQTPIPNPPLNIIVLLVWGIAVLATIVQLLGVIGIAVPL